MSQPDAPKRPGGGALLLAAAIALTVSVLLAPLWSQEPPENTSLSASLAGHRAFVEVLERMGLPVRRWRRSYTALEGVGQTLIMIEPMGELLEAREADLSHLVQWVEAGNTLVIVPLQQMAVVAVVFGLVPTELSASAGRDGLPEALLTALDLDVHWVQQEQTQAPTDIIAEGPVTLHPVNLRLRHPAVMLPNPERMQVLLESDAGPLLCRFEVGAGAVVVASVAEPFRNIGLEEADNAWFAVTAAQTLGAPGQIWVDEAAHGLQAYPSLTHVLTTPPLLLPTLQLAAALALWLWAMGPRTTPVREAPPPSRRQKREHLRAVGALLAKGRSGAFTVGCLMRGLERELARKLGLGEGADQAALAAVLERRDPRLARRLIEVQQQAKALETEAAPNNSAVLSWGRQWHALREEIFHG